MDSGRAEGGGGGVEGLRQIVGAHNVARRSAHLEVQTKRAPEMLMVF